MSHSLIGQASIETRQLADFLSEESEKKDCNTVIPYDTLSEKAGVDVRDKPNVLQSARRIVLREKNVWYGTVRGEGIKLCTSREASGEGESGRRSIVRTANRSLRKMGTANYNELTQEEKTYHNVNASLLGAVGLMNTRSSRKRLEGAVKVSEAKISMGDMIKLFGGGKDKSDDKV